MKVDNKIKMIQPHNAPRDEVIIIDMNSIFTPP